ncbi:MAG: GxxExxY protein [Spirochaetota bacterium]
MPQTNFITEKIIGCAIAVHREFGPGVLESVYENSLCVEFDDTGIRYAKQCIVPAFYKHINVGNYRVDLLVEDKIIVEIKAVEVLLPIHEAQIIHYLKLTKKRIGLIMNFNVCRLADGIRRFAV